MVRALVVSDALGATHAAHVEAALTLRGLEVVREERPRYPIADSMPLFLQSRSDQADVCIAVISEHPNAIGWVANELCNELLYPSWLIAFAPGVTVVDRFRARASRVILPGDDAAVNVAAALGLPPPPSDPDHGPAGGASTSSGAAQHLKPVE